MMTPDNSTERDDDARRVAVALLSQGLATPSEVAALAGVSRQLVRYWIKAAKLKWRRARDARLAKEWRKRIRER